MVDTNNFYGEVNASGSNFGSGTYNQYAARQHPQHSTSSSEGESGSYSGRLKNAVCTSLVRDWLALATELEIPAHERAQFDKGEEAYAIWDWLETRGRLRELHDALCLIGRRDLALLLDG